MGDSPDTFDLWMALRGGPDDDSWTEEQLRRGWAAYKDEVVSGMRPAHRPWAFWAPDVGEQMPASDAEEILRLLTLEELSPEEVVVVERRAHDELHDAERMAEVELEGGVTTGPADAAVEMCAARESSVDREPDSPSGVQLPYE